MGVGLIIRFVCPVPEGGGIRNRSRFGQHTCNKNSSCFDPDASSLCQPCQESPHRAGPSLPCSWQRHAHVIQPNCLCCHGLMYTVPQGHRHRYPTPTVSRQHHGQFGKSCTGIAKSLGQSPVQVSLFVPWLLAYCRELSTSTWRQLSEENWRVYPTAWDRCPVNRTVTV